MKLHQFYYYLHLNIYNSECGKFKQYCYKPIGCNLCSFVSEDLVFDVKPFLSV